MVRYRSNDSIVFSRKNTWMIVTAILAFLAFLLWFLPTLSKAAQGGPAVGGKLAQSKSPCVSVECPTGAVCVVKDSKAVCIDSGTFQRCMKADPICFRTVAVCSKRPCPTQTCCSASEQKPRCSGVAEAMYIP